MISPTCLPQGVLARAEWLRQDLENEGHLRALMGTGDDVDWPSGSNLTDDSGRDTSSTGASSRGVERIGPGSQRSSKHMRCRGYDLRITGHSLGGSTGVLLTYMLRRDYPSVRCIAISPMGGLLNSPYAEDCGAFVLSGVMGDDVIPRLSVASMEHMRDEVLDLIARSKVRGSVRTWVRFVVFGIGERNVEVVLNKAWKACLTVFLTFLSPIERREELTPPYMHIYRVLGTVLIWAFGVLSWINY